MAGAVGRPHLILTLDSTAASPQIAELVAQVAATVSVPALAAVRDSIPALIRSVLDELPEGSRPALSPAALQSLMRWHWPGNIAELRGTVEALAREFPGSTVQRSDLPAHLRDTTGRRLSRMETAERDAIVAALERAAGNRSAAAAELGIGRTTLYRKMRSFGITGEERLAH